jgi:hypothetical protein
MSHVAVNYRMVGGIVDTVGIVQGSKPYPWILIPVRTGYQVYDNYANCVSGTIFERVVIQGERNSKDALEKVRGGGEILVSGQIVPARVACADSDIRGHVLLVANISGIINR